MTTKAKANALVSKLINGTFVRSEREPLGKSGRVGVDLILDALEGNGGPPPKGRNPRDVFDDLVGGLHWIAQANSGPLLAALDDRPRHASSLIVALCGLRTNLVVRKLTEYSKHKDVWVRWAAIEGLARCQKKSRLQPLLEALRDRSDNVRFAALEGLAKIPDRSAIEPLKRYLAGKRPSPGGTRIARKLLAKLEGSKQ